MQRFVLFCLRLVLALRYSVEVKGLKELKPNRGLLFLANHPAEIDPVILIIHLLGRFQIRPVAADFVFHIPILSWFVKKAKTIPIPGFDLSSNSFKKRRIEKTYETVSSIIREGGHVLVYPAGLLKVTAEERVGAASGVYELVQRLPDVKIVLVRTTGLWGSSFSKAITGKRPDMVQTMLFGVKSVLKNLIFFTPRRKILIELEEASGEFPRTGSKLEINKYLEEWFNQRGVEELKLISFSCWKKQLPQIVEQPKERKISLDNVPEEIQERVLEELSALTQIPKEHLSPEMELAQDLGLDSLDKSQVAIMLREQFGVTEINSTELSTIQNVMVYAAHIKEDVVVEEEKEEIKSLWGKEKGRPDPIYPDSDTLLEGFFETADKLEKFLVAADQMSGEVSYKRFKLGVILFASYLKELPGEKIGVMLPASIAVQITILACQLAGKVPVMINWTLGVRNLHSIVEQTGIEATISSWKFLDRLNDIELGPLDDQIELLEEIRAKLTVKDRLNALLLARKSSKEILRAFGREGIKKEDTAIVLFTSGTESYPKGVPLSHFNVMENHRSAAQVISLKASDVILGILPPFHSFGFSITGMLPVVGGFRVAYSPNPTNGRQIAYAMEHWQATIFCSAPTFMKNILRVAKKEQLKSLRIVILGAEKTPDELYKRLQEFNPEAHIIEGYGITECAPVLTINRLEKEPKGVGEPLPGVEIKIVNYETLKEVPKGESGLILARGNNIFSGYLGGNSSPFIEFANKKWYNTGDLGSLDSENRLTIDGRLKRFIKIGGEMISLGMIEEVLNQIAQKASWDVAKDVPSFAVVAEESGSEKSVIHLFTLCNLSVEEVNRRLREEGMSNLIKVQSVNRIQAIPLLGTGKVDYRALTNKLKSPR